MSSTISLIHDELNTMLNVLFPTRSQLTDGFLIENNAEIELDYAYGLHFGTAFNTNRLIGCQFSIQRQVIITITKATRAGQRAIGLVKTAEKDLLEDHLKLIKDFAKNENLNDLAVKRSYVSDNGIDRIFGQQKNFLMIQSTFDIEYFENLQ
jgi:hypothetical protein